MRGTNPLNASFFLVRHAFQSLGTYHTASLFRCRQDLKQECSICQSVKWLPLSTNNRQPLSVASYLLRGLLVSPLRASQKNTPPLEDVSRSAARANSKRHPALRLKTQIKWNITVKASPCQGESQPRRNAPVIRVMAKFTSARASVT